MKKEFSRKWMGSRQPRKQRKYRINAPLHVMHRFLSANLSKELRKKYGKRSLPVRKGDEVLVMRGKFTKKKAKVISVDLKKQRIVLDGINRDKKDGTKINVYFNAGNLQIQTLNLEDKKRMKVVEREKPVQEKQIVKQTEIKNVSIKSDSK